MKLGYSKLNAMNSQVRDHALPLLLYCLFSLWMINRGNNNDRD